MMSKALHFIMFVLGAAVGSVVTGYYIKNKYEQIVQEEIDSVKAVYTKKDHDINASDSKSINTAAIKAINEKEKPNIVEYASKLREQGYTNYSDPDAKKEEKSMSNDKPYVISPDEFGDFDEYEKISLTYYADQILADDNDDLVDDVDNTVGFEALSSFGEYEDDSVFVRNDRLKCDYEILLDQRSYSDVVNRMSREVDD